MRGLSCSPEYVKGGGSKKGMIREIILLIASAPTIRNKKRSCGRRESQVYQDAPPTRSQGSPEKSGDSPPNYNTELQSPDIAARISLFHRSIVL